MVFFFEWLAQKGVERIIKVLSAQPRYNMCSILSRRQVIVEDLKAPSHSDQAIEKSLKPFVSLPFHRPK